MLAFSAAAGVLVEFYHFAIFEYATLVYTLSLLPRAEIPADSRYEYWLKLADIALARGRT